MLWKSSLYFSDYRSDIQLILRALTLLTKTLQIAGPRY